MISPKAMLFDMDGTLIDSSPAVEVAWCVSWEPARIEARR